MNGLREFVFCVEFGSMAKAAENLGITKSSVSKRIAQLEKRFNKKLFYRKNNSLHLTRYGELAYEKSKKIFASLNELDDIFNDSDYIPEGELSISMPIGVGESLIQPIIVSFQKKYPLVKFNLNFSVRRVDMAKEGYDISFRLASQMDEDIVAKRLLHRPYHLVASPEFFNHFGSPNDPENLLKYPCLSYSEKRWQGVKSWRFKNKITNTSVDFNPNPVICSDSVDSLVIACINGAGLLYCSEFFIVEHLQNGKLQSVLQNWITDHNTLWITFPSSLTLTHRARIFIDHTTDYFLHMNQV